MINADKNFCGAIAILFSNQKTNEKLKKIQRSCKTYDKKTIISKLSLRVAVSAMLYQTKTISTGLKAANLLSYRVERLDALSKFTTVLHRYLANKRIGNEVLIKAYK